MKISWGLKVGLLYASFVVFMVTLVVASTRHKFDLVSNDYYKQEIGYQKVLDAGRNQAALSDAISIQKNEDDVVVTLPNELSSKMASGEIKFYSPVNEKWDRSFAVKGGDSEIKIARKELRKTRYTVKMRLSAEGKEYYEETVLQLSY